MPAFDALLLLAMSSGAQTVADAQPPAGTPDAVVVVTGSGFGPSKPKVWLTQPDSSKRYKLKTLEWDDGQIITAVRKAVAGTFDVAVSAKVADEVVLADAFTVEPPQLDSVTPTGEPLDELLAEGEFLGWKKLVLRVGGKRCKVTELDGDLVRFKLSKALPNGPHDLFVSNSIGEDTLPGAVLVTGSDKPLGKPLLSAELDFQPFVLKAKSMSATAAGGALTLVGSSGSRSITLVLPWVPSDGFPITWSGTATGVTLRIVQSDATGLKIWENVAGGLPWTVTLLAVGGGQVRGEFSGFLFNVTGGADLFVTNGTFLETLDDADG